MSTSSSALLRSSTHDSSRAPATRRSSSSSSSTPRSHYEVPTHLLTLRGLGAGLLIGTVVAFSNMYFGLQTGWVSMMSMPASLIGFAIFKTLSNQLRFPFTPVENVLVQTVAVAVGSMPLSVGYVGVIPALEKLLKPSEGGPLSIGLGHLFLWGLGVAFFGVFFTVPLRKQVILREKLKFPSGTATALMISVLHGSKGVEKPNENVGLDDDETMGVEADDVAAPPESDDEAWKRNTRLLLYSFAVSGVYTLISYFLPIIRDIPFLGTAAASNWLWTLNPSPAYVGQGIIMGPSTTAHMLLGAIIGWGVLSPLAKHQGWAPGPVRDYTTGSRGWLIWVSLAIMLADSLISLGWVAFGYIARFIRTSSTSSTLERDIEYDRLTDTEEYVQDSNISSSTLRRRFRRSPIASDDDIEDDAPPDQLVPLKAVAIGLFASSALCIFATKIVFSQIPLYAITAALPLAFILSVVGTRALGQTDLNPVSGISKLTQLVFALIVPASNPVAVLVNLVAGALSEAGAQQAGDIMQDLKTGHLLKAAPRTQFYGQILGSIWGAIVSALIYRLYDRVYPIPGKLFQVPTAYVWIDCSRLVYGQGLPSGARSFALAFGILFTVITVWKQSGKAGSAKWGSWIPGGVAVAVGMYNVPSFTLARAVGGAVQWWWERKDKGGGGRGSGGGSRGGDAQTALVVVASGLILGEGIVSLVNLGLANAGVPHA